MPRTIVVLGASYGGLPIAHYLLKHVQPTEKDLKVVLVSKNSHMFWNMATVRAIVPGTISNDELLKPIEPGFAKYPQGSFEFIVGGAEATNFADKTVTVSGSRTLRYDQLVLATGSRPAETSAQAPSVVPWKAGGTHEEIVALLDKTRDRVAAARHIVVAGAGPTGVEVAGELGFEYAKAASDKKKDVVLLSADSLLLKGDSLASNAAGELTKLGVQIRTDSGVKDAKTLPNGKTEITLRNGETITTDLYLPTMGLKPNSDFVDAKYKNEHGYVQVDQFHRVKGADSVWAVGDIVSVPRAGFFITQKQAGGVAKNIESALKGKDPAPVKPLPFDVLFVATGRSRGVGRVGGVKVFSLMVWLAKVRTMGMQYMAGTVDGSSA